MKTILTSLAKNVFLSLRVIAAASAIDAAIQRKIYGSGKTTLIILNKEMKGILVIVENVLRNILKNQGLLGEGVSETFENEAKQQKGGFLPFLLGILGTSLLRSMFSGKRVVQVGMETIRVGQDFYCRLIV